jgi:hypothetical protein
MKRIQRLIALLLAFNTIEIPKDKNYFERLLGMLGKMRQQGIVIDKLRMLAKQEGTLLGRIICLGIGEFKCFYVITKVYPKTVQIDWLNYGDGWSDARAGHQALLDIRYAKAYVDFEDNQGGILPKPKIICPTVTASPERLKEFTS